ncbi:hypothetical protein EYF80_050625 [Liparis tanakae]|uniref:Uncharacterized protein n=1 Tax=Liparis tanakae TaxID=230148 RepID=A0A4Z2FDA1_9TELE|nr:hypothetical protein EYF80_050625 [Liparis tanakae]
MKRSDQADDFTIWPRGKDLPAVSHGNDDDIILFAGEEDYSDPDATTGRSRCSEYRNWSHLKYMTVIVNVLRSDIVAR